MAATRVEITRLLPLFPNGAFIQWDLVNPPENTSFIFSVYRSGSPEGPWEALRGGAVDVYNFVDRLPTVAAVPPGSAEQPNQLSLARGIYYKVVATDPSGVDYAAVSLIEPKLTGWQRRLKRKILRDESLLLRKLNGVEVAVVKRMHWGPRCTKCFDKYTKEVVRGHCTTCLGTGFTPGYHTPVITLARRSPTPVQTVVTAQGKTDTSYAQVTLLDAPKVEEEDILVFLRDNRRFIVKQVLQTELQTHPVHQKLSVSELMPTSVEFKIVVDPLRTPPLF